jgi:hypothetical protein
MTITALRALNTKDALEACHKLAPAARKQLFIDCPAWDHRILLVLNVVNNLTMDDGFEGISGVTSNVRGTGTIGDYGEARMFLLKQRAAAPNADSEIKAKDAAWTRWFYPEYRRIGNARERLTRIAEDHVNLNNTHLMQKSLFSMNGYFHWNDAGTSAHTHTTCALFVRACRAAARLLEKKKWATNTQSGTDPCITGPSTSASVLYGERGAREPQRGDIFHVNSPGKNNAHVGIILDHRADRNGDWHWRTAEAGQGDGYQTKLFEDRILKARGGKHWHGTGVNERPLVKWIDLDQLVVALGARS